MSYLHDLILDQTLCNFPFEHDETQHFSPITDDEYGTTQCKRGETLEDCSQCDGMA